jgi:F0F1-type ATP synthase epsilon subunit
MTISFKKNVKKFINGGMKSKAPEKIVILTNTALFPNQ